MNTMQTVNRLVAAAAIAGIVLIACAARKGETHHAAGTKASGQQVWIIVDTAADGRTVYYGPVYGTRGEVSQLARGAESSLVLVERLRDPEVLRERLRETERRQNGGGQP